MSDVACVVCTPVIAEVRSRGFSAEPLVRGLGFDLAVVENPRRRIPWDPFTVFVQRTARLLGGAEEIEEIAARCAAEAVPPFLQRLLPHLGSARSLYLLGARWWGPWVFRGTRATCEELADGRLRQVIEILPGYRVCPELFTALRGTLRAMPLLFGQPEAVVELDHDQRRAEFVITLPPSRRRRRRLAATRLLSVPEDLEEMGFAQEQLRESLRRARLASELLADRTRRLDSIRRLGQELVACRGSDELGDAMLELLRDRLSLRGLSLLRRRGQESDFVSLAAHGERSGPPLETHPLRSRGRTVGLLELWPSPDAPAPEREAEWLGELLPWLALAVEQVPVDEASERTVEAFSREVDAGAAVERHLEAALTRAAAFSGPDETILLVEEDAIVRGSVRRVLEQQGYAVAEARNGREALAICERRIEPIDLLLTDAAASPFERGTALRALEMRPELRGILMLRLGRS